jgi:transposase
MNQLHVVALNEGLRCKKSVAAAGGPDAVGIVSPRSVGQATPPGSARLARSVHAEDPGTNQDVGRGGGEATSGSATPDPSWSGPADRAGVRASHWHAERFQCAKQIASYVGLVPSEESSGDRRRLGHITKQGNSLLRFLLVEAAQA